MTRLGSLVAAMVVACGGSPHDLEFASVARGSLVVRVEIEGVLEARDAHDISPPSLPNVWNYQIAMLADEGATVREGEPLVVFDTADLQRRLDEKTAERDSATTQLQLQTATAKVARRDERLAIAQARAELETAVLKAEIPEDLESTIEIEKTKLDLDLARGKLAYLGRKSKAAASRDAAEVRRWDSQRERAQERITEITTAIEQMTVLSPRAGTVIYRTNWKGEKKKVGDSSWRGETILQVVSLETMKGAGSVDEIHMSDVALDQRVSMRLEARADVELAGVVEDIARTVQRASAETPRKVLRVDIGLVDEEATKLRPGMRFRGTIETDRIEDAIIVPLDAVVSTSSGPLIGRKTGPGSFELVAVTLGAHNETHAEVIAGLEAGEAVAVATGGPS